MKTNFDEIIDRRNTNALNTDGFRGYIFHAGPEKVFPFKDEEFVRMWVADMEFATPPAICEAMKARIDRRIFGYTMMLDDAYYRALNGWCMQRYDWSFRQEELCFSPGIIPALYQLVEDLIGEGESFVITTPSYGYFLHAAEYNGVPVVCSDLAEQDGYFSIDFEDLERKCAAPEVKMLLWCNPHNPTGRIWTEEELRRVAQIVEEYDLWLVSDEIHCDLIRKGLHVCKQDLQHGGIDVLGHYHPRSGGAEPLYRKRQDRRNAQPDLHRGASGGIRELRRVAGGTEGLSG